jgi:hypothetical protein
VARTDDVYRIYAAIVNGTSKDDSPITLDVELSGIWDSIAAEVASAPAGTVFDIPFEHPEVEVPAPVTPGG